MNAPPARVLHPEVPDHRAVKPDRAIGLSEELMPGRVRGAAANRHSPVRRTACLNSAGAARTEPLSVPDQTHRCFEEDTPMLLSLKDLKGFTLSATDGDIGEVKDFYFDDEAWVIRYFIVDTGTWLSRRRVLISPHAIDSLDWPGRRLSLAITQDQVKNSPEIDTDQPVSRQHEMQHLGYYGYPYYWGGAGLWPTGAYAGAGGFGLPGGESGSRHVEEESARAERALHEDDDPHLRSCEAVVGYHIKATDGGVGHVESLLINQDTWAIQYLVINTSNWWVGHHVLIAPEWVDAVSWLHKTLSVDLDCASIKSSPAYESTAQLNREREQHLYDHHGRSGYWVNETFIERVET